MASTTPSKSWMKEVRTGLRYQDGVDSFLAFAYKNSKGIDWYLCPCIKCGNVGTGKTLKELREHLICNGIMQSYTTWYCHGEPIQDEVAAEFRGVPNNAQGVSRIFSLVNDTLGNVQPENLDACMDEIINNDDIRTSHEQDPQVEECSNKSKKAKKLREDGSEPIYPSCKPEDTKLSVIVELVSLKSTGNWSDNSFDSLLKFLKRILPTGNSMPDNSHESLEMIKSLGMTYESIHACPNDCILYRKDHKDKTQCPKCGENRYKPEFLVKKRGVPKKVLRYFPLTPRLRRLYSIPWIAKMMKWHSNTGSPKGYMSHPADSSCWKGIDAEYPDFALEKRNVRLGLSTDGFNPFGNKILSYSCWPVMIVPYNLPPSFCMLKEFTMLSSLIPGKSSPGKNIDVYLEPLVDELTDLWEVGSLVYDSSVDPSIEDPSFRMKAVLLGTIQDYPAYGYVAGCKTAGKYGCPICGEDITSIWLKYGRRFAHLGHRCFLSVDHVFRFQKSQFNGKEEHRKAPRRLTGDEVLNKVKKLKILIGRVTKRRRLCTDDEDGCTSWSKESSLFKLPYWKILVVRNNLDVMHVEKNMTENLLATIMGSSKTKDGLHARLDLKEMNIRGNLWPVDTDKGPSLPQAPFLLSKAEKVIMCQTLKNLKVPIGYSSNWFHNVSMEDLQIRCPKSHDYHIVMQQLLPVILMHAYKRQRPLGAAIRQLSLFFNVLCSKVINCKELELASKQIVEVLCVFEKCFPPSFFVSMTHLVVHLAEEARICGPVRFRWMYPFERMMKTYKMYVKNKRHPEGCIAERYLVEESILYCKEYLPSGSIGGHGRARKTMFEEAAECFDEHPIDKKGKRYSLSNLEYEQARRWVLESSDDVAEWREKYQTYKETHPTKRKRQRGSMAIEKAMDFIPWLRQQLEPKEMTTLKRLATGPSFKAISYNAYQSNGYRFCTSKSELRKTTQNSGVTMTAVTPFRSSAKDKNQVEREVSYYGIIKLILELDYYEFKQTVFYCDWVCIEDKVNGCVIDPETKLTFVNFRRFKTNTKKDDEPFVLASQASQVFYCKDPQRDDWHVVLNAPKRLTRKIDAFADPLIFEPDVDIDAFGPTLAEEVLDEVMVDVV